MSSLLATAVLAAAYLLPTPLPLPLPGGATGQDAPPATVAVAGTLSAADGRLRRGCKDYQYAYSATAGSDDWYRQDAGVAARRLGSDPATDLED